MKKLTQNLTKLILSLFIVISAASSMSVYADNTYEVSFTNPVKDGDGNSLKAFIAFRLAKEDGTTADYTGTYGDMYFKNGITSFNHNEVWSGTKYYLDSKNYRLYEFEPRETITMNIPADTVLEPLEFCYETEFSSNSYYVP